jgi:Tubulin-tyrosine ligase family
LREFFDGEGGYGCYDGKIVPRMKDLVITSLKASQDFMLNCKKNSAEFFGYDFSFDDDLKSWLIEINSGPSFEYASVSI